MAAYKERIDRLAMLVTLIPVHLAKEDCPDPGRLLTSMAEQYDLRASRRAIQRDLEALVKEGRIAVVNPGGKPLRYRRLVNADAVNLRMWDYARQLMGALIRDALPERRLERIWAKLREEGDEFGLGRTSCAFSAIPSACCRRISARMCSPPRSRPFRCRKRYRPPTGIGRASSLVPPCIHRPCCSGGRGCISLR